MACNGTLAIPHWSLIPGLLIVTLAMVSWGSVFGMIAARYRDLRFLLPSVSNLLFFLTPIYWHVDLLGPKAWIATANPLYNLISILRQPLLGLTATDANWIYSSIVALVGVIAWFILFSLFRRRITFWV